jgi:hypothetical protein
LRRAVAINRENKELCRVNEILKLVRVFLPTLSRNAAQVVKSSFDQHRDTYGPLWKVLQIARSGYRRQPPTSGISNCIEFGLDGCQAWQGYVHLPWGMQPLLARWVASIGNIRRTA